MGRPRLHASDATRARAYRARKRELASAPPVWLNPPYSTPGPWINRMIRGWRSGEVGAGVVLIAYRALVSRAGAALLCVPAMPAMRVRFLTLAHADKPLHRPPAGARGCARGS